MIDDPNPVVRGNILCRAVQLSGDTLTNFLKLPRDKRDELKSKAAAYYGKLTPNEASPPAP